MVTVKINNTPVIDPDQQADIHKFEQMLARYKAGEVPEDVMRVFRLNNGIYGQRQGGTRQMVRIKIPAGIIQPAHFEALAHIARTHSRGWGHITTRQNIQFHFVELDEVPEVMRILAAVGLTTREACGDTVRNVQGCHLAGACPHEMLDITAWAQATANHFLRHPYAQRLPRKFKINFSGCSTDCGQAMFNDVGVVATIREIDGGIESGFRVFVAGGLGANPHPALALEDFTSREDLLPTLEACLRVFDHDGNRENKLRARMKWLVEQLGFEELQRRILRERKFLLASSSWPGGIPKLVEALGDAPAGQQANANGTFVDPTPVGQGVAVSIGAGVPFERWQQANVVRGVAKGTVSAYAWARLGDITTEQFEALADIQRELNAECRVTNRQNIVFRNLTDAQLPRLFDALSNIAMAEPGAELLRDVVACPGADTCNLAVTQSRGLADAIGERLEEEGLAEVGGLRINISGCTNSCGQHHASDIGFFGAERRAHGRPAPGYQMLLGGYVGDTRIHFGAKALRLPARNAAEAVVRVVRKFTAERKSGEEFRHWLERCGGAREVGKALADLDEFPLPDKGPEYYVDFDETRPYEVVLGESECAT
ncbi:MAG: nitrite/sulfite reductase [Acidimicrobiia bacterium]|nr:nitrite/sulfite reductase [Acidimicrobiia bacterium]MYC58127.1 nitrite/sulfite reductase [Acidimicrobiia bacterium]MYI30559.1 nitrite/sulfite reductase [Acidimicrobiia bacterium]